jgi:hypothetical protein
MKFGTDKIGTMVAYLSPYGQCYRTSYVPCDPHSPAQNRMRAILGSSSRAWAWTLTELQRQR